MKKLSVDASIWHTPFGAPKRPEPEPKDRLEQTRAYVNELEERIAKLEDVVFILTGRKSSVPPAPASKGGMTPVNHFDVDGSKPGGQAFLAAVKSGLINPCAGCGKNAGPYHCSHCGAT